MTQTREQLYSYHTPKTGKSHEEEWRLYKKLLSRVFIIIMVLLAMYFWGLAIISNMNTFWQTFNLGAENPTQTKQDKTSPAPPLIANLPAAVKEERITVNGFTEEGTVVELYINDIKVEKTLSDKEGRFSFEDIPLSGGQNEIFAKAVDTSGNESQPSRKTTVTLDKIAPNLEVSEPKNLSRFEQKEEEITIKGKAEPDTKVTVNGQQIIVDQEGVFNSIYALKDGKNDLVVEAEDLAGNKTKIERTVFFSRTF